MHLFLFLVSMHYLLACLRVLLHLLLFNDSIRWLATLLAFHSKLVSHAYLLEVIAAPLAFHC